MPPWAGRSSSPTKPSWRECRRKARSPPLKPVCGSHKEREGYLLTPDIPSYLPVMTTATTVRCAKEMYRAYSTRASDQAERGEMG